MSDAFERLRDSLESNGAKFRDVRQNHFMSTCPAHPDKNPSLGVDDKGDRVMVRCYAGCYTDDVLAEVGLELKDLFDSDDFDPKDRWGQFVRSYLYEKANGEPWFHVDRYYPKTFRQRLPDVEPVRDLSDKEAAKRLGLRGRAPVLYRLPRLHRALRSGEAVVWFLDGEKDVETAERHGLLATCPPGFAKWDEKYAHFLKDAAEVVMVVDQDKEKPNGELGAGQATAVTARNGFRSLGLKVRVVAPAAGKDLTDHFAAGFGVEDFVPEPTIYTRPRGMDAANLMQKEFAPLSWAVQDVLPAGLVIMAGSPKVGKTWVGLSISLAVAAGGPALSVLPTCQGSVLHLAREDGYRRLQSRIGLLSAGLMDSVPKALELVPTEQEWVGGEEGIANMTEWAEEVGDPRLVVIDTLQKVEPDMGEDMRRGAYTGNYSMMARYKQWADIHNCCVLMVHHDNKTKPDRDGDGWMLDPYSQISGTRGITGAADTLLFLENKRGTKEGRLHVTGRDVSEQSLELYKSGPIWNVM